MPHDLSLRALAVDATGKRLFTVDSIGDEERARSGPTPVPNFDSVDLEKGILRPSIGSSLGGQAMNDLNATKAMGEVHSLAILDKGKTLIAAGHKSIVQLDMTVLGK